MTMHLRSGQEITKDQMIERSIKIVKNEDDHYFRFSHADFFLEAWGALVILTSKTGTKYRKKWYFEYHFENIELNTF